MSVVSTQEKEYGNKLFLIHAGVVFHKMSYTLLPTDYMYVWIQTLKVQQYQFTHLTITLSQFTLTPVIYYFSDMNKIPTSAFESRCFFV
jgi:hypothetical protein